MIYRLDPALSAAFSPCGRWLATAAEVVTLWDMKAGQRLLSWPVRGPVAHLCFSRQSRLLAAREEHSEVTLFDLDSQKKVGRHHGTIRVPRPFGMVFGEAEQLVECSYDGGLYRFDREGALINFSMTPNASFLPFIVGLTSSLWPQIQRSQNV